MEANSSKKISVDIKRRRLNKWLWRIPVLIASIGIIGIIQRAYKTHFQKLKPKETPTFVQQEPTLIAPLNDFSDVWDKAEFMLGTVPAIALYTPRPISGGISVQGRHFIAFSRICTHLGCPVNFIRDVEAITLAANHRVNDPVLVCHCHLSLFNVLKAGRAISGPAVEPLPRIQLKVENDYIVAVGIESV